MANSDNVVRAGLSPKYKDFELLLEMLTYNLGDNQMKDPEEAGIGLTKYVSGFSEFNVTRICSKTDQPVVYEAQTPSIAICISGEGKCLHEPLGTKEGIDISTYNTFYLTPQHSYEFNGDMTLYIAHS